MNNTIPVWKQILRTNFIRWDKLASFLELNSEQQSLFDPHPRFALNLPLRLAGKIAKGDIHDPILRQFAPLNEEQIASDGFLVDPVGDLQSQCSSKLLHKYEGRALLLCSSACAMHCRYCFRQNYPYETTRKIFDEELKKIAEDDSLREIILSGGDPLSLSNEVLQPLFEALNQIPHIRRLRIHSRYLVGIPERIDEQFLGILSALQKQVWFVIHVNHPKEFDEDIWRAVDALRKTGAVVMNQAVLLKGVNDCVEILKELCEDLVDHGVLPYYLHQLDRVQGASHFEVSEEKGRQLIEELRSQLSGYAVPLYVKEIAGETSKTPL